MEHVSYFPATPGKSEKRTDHKCVGMGEGGGFGDDSFGPFSQKGVPQVTAISAARFRRRGNCSGTCREPKMKDSVLISRRKLLVIYLLLANACRRRARSYGKNQLTIE